MRRSTLILTAATLDWLLGDPESLPHPVRLIGAAITHAESLLHPAHSSNETSNGDPIASSSNSCCHPRRQSAVVAESSASNISRSIAGCSILANTHEFLSGLLLTATITTAAYLLPATIHNPILQILLASTTLAARNLDDEACSVLTALNQANLPLARQRLSRIVGRDTAALDQPALCRALIETLAESLSDGIVAPLFYFALGGLPAAMAFKAISTMDSMIGHRTPRYLYFGRPAARLDDAANYLPARLTAHALLAFARNPNSSAYPIYRRDRYQHASPNAGHPEAAIAAVLGIQLGGPSTYQGEPHQAPHLNPGARLPVPADAHRALVLTRAVAIAATLLAAAVCLAFERRAK